MKNSHYIRHYTGCIFVAVINNFNNPFWVSYFSPHYSTTTYTKWRRKKKNFTSFAFSFLIYGAVIVPIYFLTENLQRWVFRKCKHAPVQLHIPWGWWCCASVEWWLVYKWARTGKRATGMGGTENCSGDFSLFLALGFTWAVCVL